MPGPYYQQQQHIVSVCFTLQNTILKNKKINQSDFRVHFTLIEINWKGTPTQLIEEISRVVPSSHLIQLTSSIEDHQCDVTVGMSNDIEAFQFLSIKRDEGIKINNGRGHEFKYMPVISRVFQSFMKKLEKQRKVNPTPHQHSHPQIKQITIQINKNAQLNSPYKKQLYQQQKALDTKKQQQQMMKHQQQQKQQLKYQNQQLQQEEQQQLVHSIWAFGVPIQYQPQQLFEWLQKKGIEIKKQEEEQIIHNFENMQYIVLKLLKPIPISQIYQLNPKVDNYPYIITPELKHKNHIPQQLSKFTHQILIKQEFDNEKNIIMLMDRIQGVTLMLRYDTHLNDDVKYIVAFNNINKIQKMKSCFKKQFKNALNSMRRIFMPIGRLLKFYTFQSMIININALA